MHKFGQSNLVESRRQKRKRVEAAGGIEGSRRERVNWPEQGGLRAAKGWRLGFFFLGCCPWSSGGGGGA